MKRLRRISQIAFLILFVYLFLNTTYPLKGIIPYDLFFVLSPLVSAIMILISWKYVFLFLPAIILIIVTLFLGRFFCGWICPLGGCLDLCHRFFFRNVDNKGNKNKAMWIKYYILAFLLASAILALSPAYFMEPVIILYRTFTLSFFPVVFLVWDFLSSKFLLPGKEILSPASIVIFSGGWFFLIVFLSIMALESVSTRCWCRSLCPMGALFGVFSRYSILRKKVKESCINCGICRKKCKTGAINPGNKDFLSSECVYCFLCEDLCPEKAIYFSFSVSDFVLQKKNAHMGNTTKTREPDTVESHKILLPAFSRRSLLFSFGGGIVFALMGSVDYGHFMKNSRLLRPPGSRAERDFIAKCIRCGECMKVCVTNGLQPSMFESGISGFMTPRLVPLKGYCEESCNFCGEVCPTGVIKKLQAKEKRNFPIGKACIDGNKCLAWSRNLKCLVCNEHCSYGAVNFKEIGGGLMPYVDYYKCVGCGICENKCPTGPDPAIVVYALSNERWDYSNKIK